jgi:hypothetical protein
MPRAKAPTAEPEVSASEARSIIHSDEPAAAPTELATVPAQTPSMPMGASGMYAVASLTDEEFATQIAAMKRGRDRIATIQRELMEVDVDYGLIPGTPKPTLFKPGAEKLALAYQLAAELVPHFVAGDGDTTPPLHYTVECLLHLGSFEGPVVAVGHGTANSWEKRYRRAGDRKCPNCGKTAIIKGKAEYGGGWVCFKKKDGCGSKFRDDDARILEQATDPKGDAVEVWDMGNTLLKMAEKRAFVDAVLRATASSSLFTQDVVEEPEMRVTTPAGNRVDTSTGAIVDDQPPGYDESTHGPSPIGMDVEQEPEMRTADIGTVERGGHRPDATEAQIASIRQFSKSLELGPFLLAEEIASSLGHTFEFPDSYGPKEAAVDVMVFLQKQTGEQLGKLITHLRKLSEAKK